MGTIKSKRETTYTSMYDEIARVIPKRYNVVEIINEIKRTIDYPLNTPVELLNKYINDIIICFKIINPDYTFKRTSNILEDVATITHEFRYYTIEDVSVEDCDYLSIDTGYEYNPRYMATEDNEKLIQFELMFIIDYFSKIDISNARKVKEKNPEVYAIIMMIMSSGIFASSFYEMDMLSTIENEDVDKSQKRMVDHYYEKYKDFFNDLGNVDYVYSLKDITSKINHTIKDKNLKKYLLKFLNDVDSISRTFFVSIIDNIENCYDGITEYYISTGFYIKNMNCDIQEHLHESTFNESSIIPLEIPASIDKTGISYSKEYLKTLNDVIKIYFTYQNIFNYVKRKLV